VDALTAHRLAKLEEDVSDLEGRLRALEIGYARMLGWSAGGAAVGGLAFQIAMWLFQRSG
jgi:hypothetical protein